jgi:AraC-like DNA-binding protein
MTYYHHIVLDLDRRFYPNGDLTARVMQAKRYIDQYYYMALSLDKMAAEIFLSKFHFIRIYRKYYGKTPYAYLKEARLAKARDLLRSGLSIKDVCYAVGFDSIPSFTRLYKECTGSSPAQYQRRIVQATRRPNEQFRIKESSVNYPSL